MTSPRCYSASFTDDMHQAVGALHAAFPAAPLLAAGYSLGALILTKYLAEVDQGHWPASEGARSAACAACPLFDLGGAPPQAARSDHSYMRMLLRRVSVAGEGDFRRWAHCPPVSAAPLDARTPQALLASKTLQQGTLHGWQGDTPQSDARLLGTTCCFITSPVCM